jgi:hypothetical protein
VDATHDPLLKAIRAVARTRPGDGTLRPEDESAARAVIDELTEMGLILTPARLHELHAAHLQQLRTDPMTDLDLWEPELVRVSLWLLTRRLAEERAAAGADRSVLPAPAARPLAAA